MTTITQLDPIETASRDELQALQTQRLKWTLKQAYENMPMPRRKFEAAGAYAGVLCALSEVARLPSDTANGLAEKYPLAYFGRDVVTGGKSPG